MKTKLLFKLITTMFFLSSLVSCKFEDNSTNRLHYARVTIGINQSGPMNSRLEATTGTIGSSLICAVPASISSVTSTTDLSAAHDLEMLATDNTVTLLVPLETPMRLVKSNFRSNFDRAEILSNNPTPIAIGLSDPFTLTVDDSEKNIEIVVTDVVAVSSTSPADASTDVDVSTDISVVFNHGMDITTIDTNEGETDCTGSLQLSTTTDNFSTCIALDATIDVTSDNRIFTVNPSSTLSYSTSYKIRITADAQNSAGIGLESVYTATTGFTTQSNPIVTAPTVTSTSPADSTTDVSITTDISVTFSQAMDTTTITTNTADETCSGSLQVSDDDFTTCVQMSTSSSNIRYNVAAANSNTTFSVTPASSLANDTLYKIKVTTAAQNTAGFALENTYTSATGFTTVAAAETPVTPTVSSTSPADASTDVDTDSSISVTFSEAMNDSTITTNSGDPTCSGSFQVSLDDFSNCIALAASVTSSNSNQTFTVTPSSDLTLHATYKIKITTDAQNASGTALASAYTSATGFTTRVTSVSISNLLDNGVVHTGFLIGTATANSSVASVEVSIDSGSYETATGTTSWSFALPSGANTWKPGSEHTIQVRSVSDTSTYSTVKSLTVRKGNNRDVNGDGYPDLLVGAPQFTADGANQGRVYLYLGSSSGPVSGTVVSFTGDDDDGNGYFGNAVTFGDVNGDGYGDAVIGEYRCGTDQGEAYIFYGSSSSIASRALFSSACNGSVCQTITGEAASNNFGKSVAAGDINGDGYDDVIVGAYYYNSGDGRAYIYHGGASGINSGAAFSAAATDADTIITGSASTSLGTAVTVGNFNTDDYADLVVSATYAGGTSNGQAYVFPGSSSGIVSTATPASAANSVITGPNTTYFGDRLTSGDVNGDGYDDLIATSIYYNAAYIFHGGISTGISNVDFPSGGTANTALTREFANDYFGTSVACGDVNGDGIDDVVVGAYGYQNGAYTGRAYLFQGDASGIPDADLSSSISVNTGVFTGAAGSNYLGSSATISDFNGDGISDLGVGATSAGGSGQGGAYIFNGSSTDYTSNLSQDLSGSGSADTSLVGENTGDQFGTAMH